MNRGVLTIATGKETYITHAKNLARSFRFHNRKTPTPLAIVTDSVDPDLRSFYDHIIPVQPAWGSPFRQKLSVDLYSPFDETLFIDSDCLVIKDIGALWPLLDSTDFALPGEPISSGFWYMDIPAILTRLGVSHLPKFNSGLFLFRRGEVTKKLFELARNIMDHHDDYKIVRTHSGQCGDEPALSIAMAKSGIDFVPDTGIGQCGTVDGIDPRFEIDVLAGMCRYFYKDGRVHEPTVAHFLANGWRAPVYCREVAKLKLAGLGYPHWIAGILSQAYGQTLRARVAVSRAKKNVLKRGKAPNRGPGK